MEVSLDHHSSLVQPAAFPHDSSALGHPEWFAAYTCSRQEKMVAQLLEYRSVEHFLPLYETVHRWKDRKMRLQLPLFPGYLFVRVPARERLNVLQTTGVAHIVSFNGRPAPLPEAEIEAIRRCLAQKANAAPHPYIAAGAKVRVTRGPLEGLEGVVVRPRGDLRIVISVETIMRSISVEVDASQLEPAR
jgi:transcription antitermination factor NusG